MKLPSWPVLIGTSALVIVGGIAALMFRLGSFNSVSIEQKQNVGPFIVLTRDHMGAYHKIAGLITDVETWARAHGEPCAITFGQYFDDPEKTDEDRLRSRGGCVISSSEKAEALRRILVDGAAGAKSGASASDSSAAGLSVDMIEVSDALVAVFDGSPSIGPFKVYPAAFEAMKQRDLRLNGPTLELYEVLSPTSGHTRYVFPVESSRK